MVTAAVWTRRWIAGAVGLLFVVASLAVVLAQAPPAAALPPRCPPICIDDPPDPLPPSAPRNVIAEAGDAQAMVQWDPPALRAATVQTYTVTPYRGSSKLSSLEVVVSTTSAVVARLTNGVEYTFSVVATGSGGPSAASAPSNAVVPTRSTADQPVPTGVRATAGRFSESVYINFLRPVAGTGQQVTGYRAYLYLDGSTTAVASRSIPAYDASSIAFQGLTPMAVYRARVVAILSGEVEGPPSELSNPARPITPLPAPVVTATVGPRSIAASWQAPDAAGGPPVASYRVVLSTPGGPTARDVTVDASVRSVSFAGLEPGELYIVNVTGVRQWVIYGPDDPSGDEGRYSTGLRPLFGHSPTEAYVYGAFIDFLDRSPSGGEMAAWTVALEGGTARYAFTSGLAQSDEWIGVIVDRFYRDTLGRGSDAGGRAHWVKILRTGQMTVAQVAGQFYGSAEYFQTIGKSSLDTWVRDLYGKLLLRPADSGGVAYWIGEAQRRGLPFVATAMYQSDETLGVRVESLYDVLLGRRADAGGKEFWKKQLLARGDIVLALNLAASAEYFDLAAQVYA